MVVRAGCVIKFNIIFFYHMLTVSRNHLRLRSDSGICVNRLTIQIVAEEMDLLPK